MLRFLSDQGFGFVMGYLLAMLVFALTHLNVPAKPSAPVQQAPVADLQPVPVADLQILDRLEVRVKALEDRRSMNLHPQNLTISVFPVENLGVVRGK